MAPKKEPEAEELQQTTISAGDEKPRDVLVTLRDAEDMKRALEAFLGSAKLREQQLPVEVPKHVGTARIAGPGEVRVGSWILGSRGESLVLIFRPPRRGARLGYQLVAYLEQVEGRWSVSAIHFVHLRYGAVTE